MNSLSTAYPQVAHWLNIVVILWATVAPIALYIYIQRLYSKDIPGKRLINALRTEVAEFSGMVADLTDRFARFQNKEGMRAARETKEKERTVLEQATDIAAQAATHEDTGDKASLYRKRSRLQ